MEECYASVQSRVAGAAAGKAELGQVNRPANPNHRPNRSPYLMMRNIKVMMMVVMMQLDEEEVPKGHFLTVCKWN